MVCLKSQVSVWVLQMVVVCAHQLREHTRKRHRFGYPEANNVNPKSMADPDLVHRLDLRIGRSGGEPIVQKPSQQAARKVCLPEVRIW